MTNFGLNNEGKRLSVRFPDAKTIIQKLPDDKIFCSKISPDDQFEYLEGFEKETSWKFFEVSMEPLQIPLDFNFSKYDPDCKTGCLFKDVKQTMLGQFFTKKNTWFYPQIKAFIEEASPHSILDPFAGQGDLLSKTKEEWPNILTFGYDIDKELNWETNDSLINIPNLHNSLILTNPPYLAKNSAKRRRLNTYEYFENTIFQDLYQIALVRCLESSQHVVAIVPETFLSFVIFRSDFFVKCLDSLTIIEHNLFENTDCPVCVVCLKKNGGRRQIYKNEQYVGELSSLIDIRNTIIKNTNTDKKIIFNDVNGNIALRAVDGQNSEDKICFLKPSELNYDLSNIKQSSRAITVINIYNVKKINSIIETSNSILNEFRDSCRDLLLTPFKGNNKNGVRRRRLDFNLARAILNTAIYITESEI
jgi:hypothetical protein